MHNHPSVDTEDNSEVQTSIQQPPEENASLLHEDWSVRQPRTRRRVEQEIVEVDIKCTKRKQPENSIVKMESHIHDEREHDVVDGFDVLEAASGENDGFEAASVENDVVEVVSIHDTEEIEPGSGEGHESDTKFILPNLNIPYVEDASP
ncbi:hypothetical protein L1987_69734 [Smallanthus sonchifolius]|uniref:Uncharacterized protein n=1 Tax=Smallanthus sonchifolius TaxID=185202 RepID=A0ACB9BAZ3_9ASTR|nr:hypothetical protein L1987_69734 [Smallanthus sonchifolius]